MRANLIFPLATIAVAIAGLVNGVVSAEQQQRLADLKVFYICSRSVDGSGPTECWQNYPAKFEVIDCGHWEKRPSI